VDDLVNDRSGMKPCPAAETWASAREVGDADALLAARLSAGDHVALTEAFDRLTPAVYHGAPGALGHDPAAQDVAHDVFVELWTHPGRYDLEAGSLRGHLIMQARHRAVDLVRSVTCRVAAKAAGISEGTAKPRLRLALARPETALDGQLLEQP
jgi:RNA polymerase sigma-70 factor (ECF subfamily)